MAGTKYKVFARIKLGAEANFEFAWIPVGEFEAGSGRKAMEAAAVQDHKNDDYVEGTKYGATPVGNWVEDTPTLEFDPRVSWGQQSLPEPEPEPAVTGAAS